MMGTGALPLALRAPVRDTEMMRPRATALLICIKALRYPFRGRWPIHPPAVQDERDAVTLAARCAAAKRYSGPTPHTSP